MMSDDPNMRICRQCEKLKPKEEFRHVPCGRPDRGGVRAMVRCIECEKQQAEEKLKQELPVVQVTLPEIKRIPPRGGLFLAGYEPVLHTSNEGESL